MTMWSFTVWKLANFYKNMNRFAISYIRFILFIFLSKLKNLNLWDLFGDPFGRQFSLTLFYQLIINVVIFSIAGTLIENKEFKISKNSYLEMNLDFNIQERSGIETSNNLQNPISKSYGIHEVISILEKAKNDEKIKGIVLKISKVNMGLSTIDNLRNALKNFKKSGKFIVGYEENFSLGAYYLSSVSENFYLYLL